MNPTQQISKYFTWKEAIYLNSWNRLASTSDGLTEEVQRNLVGLFFTMDKIRQLMGRPIIVHCAFRSLEYNKLIGGSTNSQHLYGCACDFHVQGLDCQQARELLKPHLEELQIRLENNTGNWLHVDVKKIEAGQNRFFSV